MTRERIFIALAEDVVSLRRRLWSHHHADTSPTRMQGAVLSVLAEDPALGVKELAARFCMTPSAATQLVNGLVRAGLLTRVKHVRDRRRSHLRVTEQGGAKLAEMSRQHAHMLSRVFAPLSALELSELHRLLRKTVDRHP